MSVASGCLRALHFQQVHLKVLVQGLFGNAPGAGYLRMQGVDAKHVGGMLLRETDETVLILMLLLMRVLMLLLGADVGVDRDADVDDRTSSQRKSWSAHVR